MKSASEWAGIWFSPGEAAKKLARMMGGTVFPPQPETIAHCEKMVRAIQRDALEAAADELEDESSQWGSGEQMSRPKVFEGPLEDTCVAADSYGNHYRPGVDGVLDYFGELDRLRVPWNQPIRLRVTVEIMPDKSADEETK